MNLYGDTVMELNDELLEIVQLQSFDAFDSRREREMGYFTWKTGFRTIAVVKKKCTKLM